MRAEMVKHCNLRMYQHAKMTSQMLISLPDSYPKHIVRRKQDPRDSGIQIAVSDDVIATELHLLIGV